MKEFSLFKFPKNYTGQESFFSIIEFDFADTKFLVIPGNVEIIKIRVKNKNKILTRFQDFRFKFNSVETAIAPEITNFMGYLYNDIFFINREYSGTINILNFLEYEKDNVCSSNN